MCPLGALLSVCSVLGYLAPVHRCACSVCCVACAVSFGHLAPVHRCARSVRCFACVVSWPTWLLFAGVPALCVVWRVRCPGPLSSCSPVCPLHVLLCWCGVLGHLAPVHRCARSVCCAACAVSWATWLLFTGVPARCVALRVRCPWPLGSCLPVCPLGALLCVCGVLGYLAPVRWCARSVCCVFCAVSSATWLLFSGVPARCVVSCVRCPGPLGSCSPVCQLWCVVLLVRCPGPLGSCSPVCPLGALLCSCGVLSHLAPVHRCVRSMCCFAFAVSWATWLLFTGVPARCVVLRVRCAELLRSCSPVCPLGALLCVCGVLGHLAPVHRCACSMCCVTCVLSCATWLLFTGVRARCVASGVRCPRPLGSCSPVCPLGALLCVCGVLGHFAAVYRCARVFRCVACAVPQATWLLFTGVPARCVVLRVRCPGPLGSCLPVCPLCSFPLLVRCPGPLDSCSPVCPLSVSCCVCGVLGHLALVHRCVCFVRCFACAVSWATWLLFTGVLARCVVLLVRCTGRLGS